MRRLVNDKFLKNLVNWKKFFYDPFPPLDAILNGIKLRSYNPLANNMFTNNVQAASWLKVLTHEVLVSESWM